MVKLKRILCVMLAAVMLLGVLAGCGDNGGQQVDDQPDFVYVPSYVKLDSSEIQHMSNCCWHDGRIYFMAGIEDGVETYEYPTGELDEDGEPIMMTEEYPKYRTALFSARDDGSDVKELPGYAPIPAVENAEEYQEFSSSSYIVSMQVDPQGRVWVCECVYSNYVDAPEGVEPYSGEYYEHYKYTQDYYVRAFDVQGAGEVANFDLSFIEGDEDYGANINYFVVDAQGNVYVQDGYSRDIYVTDDKGAQLFTLSAPVNGWINNLFRTGDGSVGALTSGDDSGSELKLIDLAAKDWGKGVPAPANAWNFIPGGGDFDVYYDTGVSVFGLKLDGGEPEKLFTWINCDVDNNGVNSIMPMPDGRILCVSNNYNSPDGGVELLTMTKTDASTLPEKTTLTFACMWLDYDVRSEIINFNRANQTYRIEVRDYSEYATEDDWNAGLTKLTTEMTGGSIPDIIYVEGMPFAQYANKGLFEDLWPFIEADAKLGGREGVVEPLFKALSTGDELYRICARFSVQTVYGLSRVVGEEPGWTLDELLAAYDTLPDGASIFYEGYTKGDILASIAFTYIDDLVDWSTGKCYFDGELFKSLLKLTERFPAEYDWEANYDPDKPYTPVMQKLQLGEQMLSDFYFDNFENYYWELGTDPSGLTFIGYPTADGSVGSTFSVSQSMAMSSKCQHKDGAWEFMRYILTEEYASRNNWQFPANRKMFDKMLKDVMTPEYYTDENGNQVEKPKSEYWPDGSEEPVPVYAMDQATADKLMAIIEDTTRVGGAYDQTVYDIIMEQCEPFFNGQKSLDDTAKVIQSRVSLYVNEQR